MWYKSIAGRGAKEISICVLTFIKELVSPDVKEIVFYSDNCCGQNRKRIISTMYLKAVAGTDIDHHTFLERGHTQNEGNSVHSTIEKAIGKTQVYTPQQYYIIGWMAKTEGKSYTVSEK